MTQRAPSAGLLRTDHSQLIGVGATYLALPRHRVELPPLNLLHEACWTSINFFFSFLVLALEHLGPQRLA